MSKNKFDIKCEIDDEGKYVVKCPEIPDCLSKGDTLEETIEALAGCLASSLIKDKSKSSGNFMNINAKIPLAPPDIFTPNLKEDIICFFLSPEISIQEYEKNYKPEDPDRKYTLQLVAERFEFIKHLLKLKKLLEQNKRPESLCLDMEKSIYSVSEDIKFHGEEYNGVDYEIEALCFYLLLTCIDTIANKKPPEFKDWLINNIDTSQVKDDCKKYIETKHKEYVEKYGVTRNFKKAVNEISEDLKSRAISHFAIVEFKNPIFKYEMKKDWKELEPEKRFKEFVDYLYDVRNNFTHNSLNSYIPRRSAKNLRANSNKKIPLSLVPLKEDNLLELVEDIVIYLVKKKLLSLQSFTTKDQNKNIHKSHTKGNETHV